MSNTRYYELYRRSSIGISLTDALDDLIREGQIPPQLAMKILLNFDKSITDNLTEKVKSRMTFRGHLDTYRFCDEVWTFIIKNPSFRLENDTMISDKIKIVACNSKKPGDV
ncbi:transcription initiation factor IIA subunit 2 [Pneumocystis murina B123]|uniref:Transcription initiation factor IIA subunit 2 n=1 Tax=Pneumocystis murina (strain B123) TaxID=1069680 RepID=A0A0W4ZX47_PNEMU|nr:transcription initiation factor IIA subunit 2 [Pneumocystis murina B123]KTW32943.1 transcription initiation factor IIA subunit 2 [Pneumocystis murina B123]